MTTMTFALLINWSGDGTTFVDESAYLLNAHVQIGMRDRHTAEDAAEQISLSSGLMSSSVMGFGSMLSTEGKYIPGGEITSPKMSAEQFGFAGMDGLAPASPEAWRHSGGGHKGGSAGGHSGGGHHSGSGHKGHTKGGHHVTKKVPKAHHYPHQVGHPHHSASKHQGKIPPDRGPIEYIADVGSCSILMENSSQRFSPDYSSSPIFGSVMPRRLVKITATDGVTTWPVFTGFIDKIDPEAGLFSDRHVMFECVDGMGLLAFQKIGMALQTNQNAGYLASLVVPLVYTPVAAGVYDTGASIMDYAADLWSADRTSAYDALRECAESEFGRFYVDKNGAPTFRARRYFLNPGAGSFTVDTTVPASVSISRDVESVFNVINVVAHPRNTVGAQITLGGVGSPFQIPPNGPSGPGLRYVTVHFHDGSGTPVGGQSLVLPVGATDYVLNEKKDNSGVDYSTGFLATYCVLSLVYQNGSEAQYLFTNTASGPLWATKFGVRGLPITSYDYVTESAMDNTSIAAYQKRTWTHDLPICADVALAYSLSQYLLGRYKTPFTRIDAVTIHNEPTVAGVNVFSVGLFGLLTVTEPQDGLSNVKLWVIGQRFHITPYDFTITYVTERADDTLYWVLGTSALGTNTRLAP